MRHTTPHVLVVASWYPTPRHPFSGIFVAAQVHALRRHHPEWRISVCNLQPDAPRLSLTRPAQLLAHWVRWQRRPAPRWVEHPDGTREYHDPAWWPPRPWSARRPALPRRLENLLADLARQGSPVDLLHAHVAEPAGWACTRLSPSRRLPLVLTEHMGGDLLGALAPGGRLPLALREAYRSCDAFLAVSSWQARLLADLCGREPEVLPNLVDETLFLPRVETIPANAPFLSVGSLQPIKRHDLLLDAYARAHRVRPSLPPLRIIGEGPLRRSLETFALALGLADKVSFLGALPPREVARELSGAGALVVTSDSESFSVVAAETLMCGRPVISTACGGPEDFVSGDNGILVPCNDAAALADALARHQAELHSPEKTAAMARCRFSSLAISSRLVRLYQELISSSLPDVRHHDSV